MQSVKVFTEWQALSVVADRIVFSTDEETEEVKAFLEKMLQTGQTYVLQWLFSQVLILLRYGIGSKLMEGVLVGKGMTHFGQALASEEKQAVLLAAQFDERIMLVHKRLLLIHGVLFSSTFYRRQLSTCDYVIVGALALFLSISAYA